MPKVGGKRKKTRTHKENTEEDRVMGTMPKSFIFKRGDVPKPIKTMVHDLREVMYPYTSMKLKESDKSKIKDYIQTSSVYSVTHLMILTSTEKHSYLRIIKNPKGPTVTFKILSYSTRTDIINAQNQAANISRTFVAPILLLNGFNQEITAENIKNPPTKQLNQVVAQMIQSLFPPINLKKAKLKNFQRCILLTYDSANDALYFRHYHIKILHTSQNAQMKKLFRSKKVPNLSEYENFSDYFKPKANDENMIIEQSDEDDVEAALENKDKEGAQQQSSQKQ